MTFMTIETASMAEEPTLCTFWYVSQKCNGSNLLRYVKAYLVVDQQTQKVLQMQQLTDINHQCECF